MTKNEITLTNVHFLMTNVSKSVTKIQDKWVWFMKGLSILESLKNGIDNQHVARTKAGILNGGIHPDNSK